MIAPPHETVSISPSKHLSTVTAPVNSFSTYAATLSVFINRKRSKYTYNILVNLKEYATQNIKFTND